MYGTHNNLNNGKLVATVQQPAYACMLWWTHARTKADGRTRAKFNE